MLTRRQNFIEALSGGSPMMGFVLNPNEMKEIIDHRVLWEIERTNTFKPVRAVPISTYDINRGIK